MRAVDIIRKKRDGGVLGTEEIGAFVRGATTGEWPDYQLAAMLMAIVLRGMNLEESVELTRAMVHSGKKLEWPDLPGPKVDKHSTGGVGDKTSLILAPLAAACGVIVPKMAGRGLGHSGGTIDKLESIPGFRTGLTIDEFRGALKRVGCAIISQTPEVAPADRVLYSLRDVTATVESIPLICGSILSKKIAEGVDALVLDVKCGRGAFMKDLDSARQLARSLVDIANAEGVRTEAIITDMDTPLGRMIGHSLEVVEGIATLKGQGPKDLEAVSVRLASDMVRLGGLAATPQEAEKLVRSALDSGKGLEKLREMIAEQGGEPRVIDDYSLLPSARHSHTIEADRSGFAHGFDAEKVGHAVAVLGGGRDRVEDEIDHAAGAIRGSFPGEEVRKGDRLLELWYNDESRLPRALEILRDACPITDTPPVTRDRILESVVLGA